MRLVAAPVAHEKAAMLGMEMLVAFEADEGPELLAENAADRGDERRGAEHETDEYGGLAVFAQEPRERPCLLFRAHDGLLAEDARAGRETGAYVIEMKMIGRADHQEIGLRLRQHGFDVVIGG